MPDRTESANPQSREKSAGRPKIRHLAARMRSDIRLAIVTLYAACVSCAVGLFAAYRLASGHLLIGGVDLLIIAFFVALTVLAWRPGKTRLAANITAVVAALAVIGVVLGLGLSPLWIFSTLVANFLMADRGVALAANGTMIAAIGLTPGVSDNTTEHATLVTVAVVTSLFSLIFAGRVHSQREQLSYLAEHDGLTGAFNRRSLDHELASLVAASNADHETHCLALLDLDDFKALNDAVGHDAGDQVLIMLAAAAEDSTREKDRFYRYGGEEFVLVLPRTTLTGAKSALSNLRRAYAAAIPDKLGPVTFSAGIAELVTGETASDWLRRADRALLRAKRNGKNRIEQA